MGIGISVIRKEAYDKVTGKALYTDDLIVQDMLHVKMLTSPHTHARIKSINITEAQKAEGVLSVITGDYQPVLNGVLLKDQPPLAKDIVRYFGEPVALVVARSEEAAARAVKLIYVEYELLPVVNSVSDALRKDAHLIHENLGNYKRVAEDIYPQAGTNIADVKRIRKGDYNNLWKDCDVTVEANYTLPQTDHCAMETRCARAKINPDGKVYIYTSTQAPFAVKRAISKTFNIPIGNVIVKVPFVGGGFGGKAPVQLELLAYLASLSVNGRLVRIANSREEDIRTSPCKMGLEAYIKLGATKDGLFKSMECRYYVDSGAYTDIGPRLSKSIAVDCSGPYNIPNISCDSYCVFTNHTYSTSYRGFSHSCYTFCLERTIEKLAAALGMSSFELRYKNAYKEGDLTPTQVKVTQSNFGNLQLCLDKLKDLIKWDEGIVTEKNGLIKAKGISCFWKTSDSPTDATSGVILTFNSDGSININCGAVEIGPGMKTCLCQLLSEKMDMDINRIFIKMEVDTEVSPLHWKTVASMTTFMAGNALIRAADDMMVQLKEVTSSVLKCPKEDLDIGNERVYLKDRPEIYVTFKDLCHGYKYPEGPSIGGQIIGRGSFVMRHLTPLNQETGAGKAGPGWTVGAQAVEIEYNPRLFTYRLLKGITVVDAGKVINPKMAEGVIMGGMNMGFGLATREEFLYDKNGKLSNTSLRTYRLMRLGEQPVYTAAFVETKQITAPYGIRGIGEHGIIGIPAAFVNAISKAANHDFNTIPVTPEKIWKASGGIV